MRLWSTVTIFAGVMQITSQIFKAASGYIPKADSIAAIFEFWLFLTRGAWTFLVDFFNAFIDFSLTAEQMDALTLIVILFGVWRLHNDDDTDFVDDMVVGTKWEYIVAASPVVLLLFLFVPNSPFDWARFYVGETLNTEFPYFASQLLSDLRTMLLDQESPAIDALRFGVFASPLALGVLAFSAFDGEAIEALRKRVHYDAHRRNIVYLISTPFLFAGVFIILWVVITIAFFAFVLCILAVVHLINTIIGVGYALFGGPADESPASLFVTCIAYMALLSAIVGIGLPRHRTLRQFLSFAALAIAINVGLYHVEQNYGEAIKAQIIDVVERGREVSFRALGGDAPDN